MAFFQHIGPRKDGDKKIEVHLVQGKNDNDVPVYAYLAVYAGQVRNLNLSLITRTTELEKYGVILASGEGEPNDEVKRHIQDTFLKPDCT